MRQLKVLIVDDSKLIRELLTTILNEDPRLQVVAAAEDPYEARELIKTHKPDVLTLDVEMPKMNGIDFLKNLMRLRPMPVVMISTLTAEGSETTLNALEIGALDFLEKPANINRIMQDYREIVIEKVIAAAQAPKTTLLRHQNRLMESYRKKQQGIVEEDISQQRPAVANAPLFPEKIVAIGGSTGGLEALRELLLSTTFQGNESIVVSLHLPAAFTTSFATRLDGIVPFKVVEAKDQEKLEPGTVYIAPGDYHLKIRKRPVGYQCELDDGERVNHHKPSVDVLFDSVAANAGTHALGIQLTGMGKDGAKGLLNLRNAGAVTYAQDEASSVVWGMPGAAVAIDAASAVMSLQDLGKAVSRYYGARI